MSLQTLAAKSGEEASPGAKTSRRVELLAMLALLCCYLVTMSGHLYSVDGLTMYRQGYSLAFYHSITIKPPFWWGAPISTSKYGIGLSLLYAPFMLACFWMRNAIPIFHDATYHGQLLSDPFYAVAAAPVQALVTAASAYLVARTIRLLGFSERAALWGLVFYGLGSPAFVYARGDYAQPLSGLCWIAAIYAALLFRQSGYLRWVILAALALLYGVLTREVDGSLALPAVMLLVVPDLRVRQWHWKTWLSLVVLIAGWAAGVAVTLVVNWMRFGSALNFGYGSESWTGSPLIGLAGSLISPARGLLWSFPAIVLLVPGVRVLWSRRQQMVVMALIGLAGAELLNTALWWIWWGGWDWGLRLFLPALPVLAVVAGCGVSGLSELSWLRSRPRLLQWLPALLLLLGILWALPGVFSNLLAGYMKFSDGMGSFNPLTYPPISGWIWLRHIRPPNGGTMDSRAIDNVWLLYSSVTNNISLVFMAALCLAAGICVYGAIRIYRLQARLPQNAGMDSGAVVSGDLV